MAMASYEKHLELESGSVKIDLKDRETSVSMETEAEAKMSRLECQKTNPMNNDLILENIFQFCDVPSLKMCRLICKKWKDLSLKHWRGKAMLKIRNDFGEKLEFSEFLYLLNSKEDDDSLQLRKYPFKRYSVEIDNWCPKGAPYWDEKRVAVAIFNSGAHHVKINWDCYHFTGFNEFLSMLNSEFLETLEVIWHSFTSDVPGTTTLLNCSNLKRLKLFTSMLFDSHSPSRSLWQYLIKSFPNLEALSIGYAVNKQNERTDYPICVADRLAIAKLLKSIRQSPPKADDDEPKIPLKELDMIDVNTCQNIYESEVKEYEIITSLAECKFPLERLSIHAGWHGGAGDKIPILPLLRSTKDTLQYLRASVNFNREYFTGQPYDDPECDGLEKFKSDLKPQEGEMIPMNALTEVRLLNGIEWAMYFLAHLETPNLEKLVVEYEKYRNPFFDDRYALVSVKLQKEEKYDKLEAFELHDNFNIPSPRMIRMFARMMPNLVHLTIPLDKRTFQMICQQFKGLKTLNILEGQNDYVELDDEVLTGISKAQLLEDGGVPSRQPNITNLEHLSNLRICCQRQLRRDDVKFTEHSVMHGFLQLPKLYYLSVAFEELSDEMEKKLLSHVNGNVYFQRKLKPHRNSFTVEITSKDHPDEEEESEKSENDSESE